MVIRVQRVIYTALSTIGVLTLTGDTLQLYTLELPRGRSIPEGAYNVVIAFSPKFQRDMPRLVDVPGWPPESIELHVGNYPSDSEGCLLLGMTSDLPDFVGESQIAFDTLYPKLVGPAAAGNLLIVVTDMEST